MTSTFKDHRIHTSMNDFTRNTIVRIIVRFLPSLTQIFGVIYLTCDAIRGPRICKSGTNGEATRGSSASSAVSYTTPMPSAEMENNCSLHTSHSPPKNCHTATKKRQGERLAPNFFAKRCAQGAQPPALQNLTHYYKRLKI